MKPYESSFTKNSCGQTKLWCTVLMRILSVTLVLTAILPAYGSIILFTGDIAPNTLPASLLPGAFTSDSNMWAFTERQGVTLATALYAGVTTPGTWVCCTGPDSLAGMIPGGTTVDSYLLYASPATDAPGLSYRDFTGSIQFSPGQKIVGIILEYQNQDYTDILFGAPGTTYPPLSYTMAGLVSKGDTVIVGPGMESVYVNFEVAAGQIDMIRILTTATATPEPAAFVLLGSGLLALALSKRRSVGLGIKR